MLWVQSAHRQCLRPINGAFCRIDLSQAEIENFCMAAIGDENVRGFDASMNDSLGMRGVERVGYIDRNVERLFQLHGTSRNRVLKGFAFQVLHSNEGSSVFFTDVVNGANIGMIECGRRLGFFPKSRECLWAVR